MNSEQHNGRAIQYCLIGHQKGTPQEQPRISLDGVKSGSGQGPSVEMMEEEDESAGVGDEASRTLEMMSGLGAMSVVGDECVVTTWVGRIIGLVRTCKGGAGEGLRKS